tara:strand:+ start:315 stop:1079 length:765 start_codon:yes stop_codon:yes gene_type:complete
MTFKSILNIYKEFLNKNGYVIQNPLTIESTIESLKDWSEIMTLDQFKDWFINQQKNCSMGVKKIPLSELNGWETQNKKDAICHESKSFFSIIGLNVSNTSSREVQSGWDQPIIMEKDKDGGIVGIIRKKINGIPYYLIEAKAEPGNPDLVQISPTLQATYSNLSQSHGGRKPYFADLFLNPKKNNCEVLFDQWMSEDGGRLYKKRNRGILLEALSDIDIETKESFCWITLFQIKSLIKSSSWVNPHTRSLISHL